MSFTGRADPIFRIQGLLHTGQPRGPATSPTLTVRIQKRASLQQPLDWELPVPKEGSFPSFEGLLLMPGENELLLVFLSHSHCTSQFHTLL